MCVCVCVCVCVCFHHIGIGISIWKCVYICVEINIFERGRCKHTRSIEVGIWTEINWKFS